MTSNPFGANFVVSWDQRAPIEDALEAGLRIVSLSFGDPAGYVDQVHDAGGLVLHSVGSAEEARRAVAAGADVVVAQGWEAGGHVWGQVATLPLVPAVVDAVAPVPVLAASGIADARGVAAVLALGAQAAWGRVSCSPPRRRCTRSTVVSSRRPRRTQSGTPTSSHASRTATCSARRAAARRGRNRGRRSFRAGRSRSKGPLGGRPGSRAGDAERSTMTLYIEAFSLGDARTP